MTARARVVAALFLACLLAGMVSGRGLLFNLAYLWGGLFAVAFLWSRTALVGISLERRPRLLRAQVGQAFEESLLLRNASRLPKLWLEFQDASELPDHQASSVVVGLGARAERALLVRTLCTRRGRFRVGRSGAGDRGHAAADADGGAGGLERGRGHGGVEPGVQHGVHVLLQRRVLPLHLQRVRVQSVHVLLQSLLH